MSNPLEGMSNPLEGLFDEDNDYHDEELGLDYHEIHPTESDNASRFNNASVIEGFSEDSEETQEETSVVSRNKKRISIKAMPAIFRQKFPNTVTILMTNKDGTQILLVAGD